ncbi:MAG: 30S ribosomal protein S6 [Acidobacteriaceae bacterium]
MPKYELMYILSSAVSDNDVPAISQEVEKFILAQGGTMLATEMLGKKKLAYPIKKTRNGFYVLQTFNLPPEKMRELDNKLRSLETIIRYLVANLDDMEIRQAKDKKAQEKAKAARKAGAAKAEAAKATTAEEIKITDNELEEKIKQALDSEDLNQ